jgi:rhodanese-related sulfurtransferase
MLAEPGTILIDVREADEHARERIVGAKLIPLSALTAKEIAELGARRVVFHCKGGRRSLDAATRCASLSQRGIEIHSVVGGIEAWRSAGLGTELNTARPKMSVMQQTQLTIGAVVVAGTALGFLVNPWFLALPAFMGSGLIFAGATGTCGLASLISMAPWNRATKCQSGSCSL